MPGCACRGFLTPVFRARAGACGRDRSRSYDINGNVIAENTRLYGSATVSFKHASLLTAALPTADLVIARDVLFHLNTAHIHAALANIRRSNSRLLLTTTFPHVSHNRDLQPQAEAYLGFAPQPDQPVWGYREINLDVAPFALAESGLESAEESWGDDDSDVASTRLLKLYSLSALSQSAPSDARAARAQGAAPDGAGAGAGQGLEDIAPPNAVVKVSLTVTLAFPGLPLVAEWRAASASTSGHWLGLFNHAHVDQLHVDPGLDGGGAWSEELLVWRAPVAAGLQHARVMSNVSGDGAPGFVMPQGGPWALAYFAGDTATPLAHTVAQDPGQLFVVTSLTGYSSRRNQFITQLLFHMEYLSLARNVLNTRAVAPTFVSNPRNHSRYEEAIHLANERGSAMDPDFKAILGLLPVEFDEVFDLAVLARYSHGLLSRLEFEEAADYYLDLLIVVDAWAIYGQACSRQPTCNYYHCPTEAHDARGGGRSFEFYGKAYHVGEVYCVPHAASGETLVLEIQTAMRACRARGGTRVAVAAVIVNHLFTAERPLNMKEEWADDALEGEHFRALLSHLVPAPHIQHQIDWLLAHRLRGGFAAVHWRRGDRCVCV